MAASPVVFPPDQTIVCGRIIPAGINYPKEQLDDAAVKPGANVQATKLLHRFTLGHHQKGGTAVVAETAGLHVFRTAGTIEAVEVVPLAAPTGGTLAFTVDVKKGNQSTGFASILSAPVTIDNTKADREVIPGTVTTSAAADGDTLEVVVAVTGSTGTQGQGFVLTVTVREEA
jgi:hypothetical protein